jgi:hypothetical protein
MDIERLVEAFEGSNSVLYLFDSHDERVPYHEFRMQCIATVSETRQGVNRVLTKGRTVSASAFMPDWSQSEIQAAGRYIANKLKNSGSPEMQALYEEEQVLDRFHQLGGLPLFVFPSCPELAKEYIRYKERFRAPSKK